MSLVKKWIIRYLEYLAATRYEIGFLLCGPEQVLDESASPEVRFLKHPYKSRWFADPFFLSATPDRLVLLAEEYRYSTDKGRIVRLTVDRHTFRLLGNDPVLELDTHLSFPFLLRENGRCYLYPENSQAGAWKRYAYDPETNTVGPGETLIPQPLTDAVIAPDGRVFSTRLPDPNGAALTIYENGREKDVVTFSEKIARSAGAFFQVGDRWYRPAQECNDCYGHAVVFQEVSRSGSNWTFREIRRLYSPHPWFDAGCHTYNTLDGISVIDVAGYRKPRLRKLLFGLVDRIQKWRKA